MSLRNNLKCARGINFHRDITACVSAAGIIIIIRNKTSNGVHVMVILLRSCASMFGEIYIFVSQLKILPIFKYRELITFYVSCHENRSGIETQGYHYKLCLDGLGKNSIGRFQDDTLVSVRIQREGRCQNRNSLRKYVKPWPRATPTFQVKYNSRQVLGIKYVNAPRQRQRRAF